MWACGEIASIARDARSEIGGGHGQNRERRLQILFNPDNADRGPRAGIGDGVETLVHLRHTAQNLEFKAHIWSISFLVSTGINTNA